MTSPGHHITLHHRHFDSLTVSTQNRISINNVIWNVRRGQREETLEVKCTK